MSFIVLGNKVEISAVEVVGHIAAGWQPASQQATQTIMKQNVVLVATKAGGYGGGLSYEEVADYLSVIMTRTGDNSFQPIHLPNIPRHYLCRLEQR
jgi:hypothetical protein